jgi:hypothetical protein
MNLSRGLGKLRRLRRRNIYLIRAQVMLGVMPIIHERTKSPDR